MRERLIELIKATPHGTKTLGDVLDSLYIENVMVKHLLANGVIVPPVKVGQTIYFLGGINSKLIQSATVEEIIINDSGVRDLLVITENGIAFEDSLETFYLTKKEAERALKEEVK